MKRLSFIPEIFIWLLFSVVAGFGYAFSFFSIQPGKARFPFFKGFGGIQGGLLQKLSL